MNRIAFFVASTLALAAATAAPAKQYDRLYVFGDSLVDSGNAQVLAPDRVPTPTGRFSNGFNFADYLSSSLGFGLSTAYLKGGINYSVGGAVAAPSQTGLNSQITGIPTYPFSYVNSVAAGVRPAITADSLVMVAIGGNDVRATAGSTINADQFGDTIGDYVRAGLTSLYNAGARNFLLVNLPDIGIIPEYVGGPDAAQLSALTVRLNAEYSDIAGEYRSLLGSDGRFNLFDLYGLQGQITADPAAFGFDPAKITQGCATDGGLPALATNCAGYLYFDQRHPTDQAHRLIGDAIAAQLAVPEPQTWALMIVGFGLAGGAVRRQRRVALA